MIEMMMGGVSNGPGARSVNGCVFESSIGSIAFERIAKTSPEKAVTAMALDAATASSEIGGNAIGMYRLKVKEAMYRNKITGELVTETTLVSPDFNDEPVGVWTDAGEHGTGTKDDYQRLISRANTLANLAHDASMLWVSPGSVDSHEAISHRAYLWVKKGDEVTAFSYSLPGSVEDLSQFMGNLGLDGERSDDLLNTTIVKDAPLTHMDVFQAFTDSFSPPDDNTKIFIDQFRREAHMPDSEREKQIDDKKKVFEKQLTESYKDDIRLVLESIAGGLIGLSKPDSVNQAVNREQPVESSDHLRDTKSKDETVINWERLQLVMPLVPAYIGLIEMMVLEPVYKSSSEFDHVQVSPGGKKVETANTPENTDIKPDVYISANSPYVLNYPDRTDKEKIISGVSGDTSYKDTEIQTVMPPDLSDFTDLFMWRDSRTESIGAIPERTDSTGKQPESTNLKDELSRLNHITESARIEPAQISETDIFTIERSVDIILRFVANTLIFSTGNEMGVGEFIPVDKESIIVESAGKLLTYLQKKGTSSFEPEDEDLPKQDMITLLKIKFFMDLYKDYDKDKGVRNLITLMIFREIILMKDNSLLSEISPKYLLPDLLDNDKTTDLYKRLNIFETIVNNLKDSTQLQTFRLIFMTLFSLDNSIKNLDKSIKIIKILLYLNVKNRNQNNSIERIFSYRNYKMKTAYSNSNQKKKSFPTNAVVYLRQLYEAAFQSGVNIVYYKR